MNWHARREGWSAQSEDARDDGDVDYSRVIHSASRIASLEMLL